MHGVFLHVLADALGSVVVIISALVIWLTEWEYRFCVDPALSVAMVCLIMWSTWPLCKLKKKKKHQLIAQCAHCLAVCIITKICVGTRSARVCLDSAPNRPYPYSAG